MKHIHIVWDDNDIAVVDKATFNTFINNVVDAFYASHSETVQYIMERTFDLDDLNDKYSAVEETYYIKYSGGRYYCDPLEVDPILTFNKDRMSRIDSEGCCARLTVTFGYEDEVYILKRICDSDDGAY